MAERLDTVIVDQLLTDPIYNVRLASIRVKRLGERVPEELHQRMRAIEADLAAEKQRHVDRLRELGLAGGAVLQAARKEVEPA